MLVVEYKLPETGVQGFASAAEAFDLSHESKQVFQMYGPGLHGRQPLIARRLLQLGVRHVQL